MYDYNILLNNNFFYKYSWVPIDPWILKKYVDMRYTMDTHTDMGTSTRRIFI